MTETPAHLGPYVSHEDILDAIEHTVRTHGLAFRLNLGRLLLDAFFDGDLHAYGDRNPHKEGRFADFFRQHHDELERYGVSEAVARSCIKGWGVYRSLPAELRESLYFSQVLELTKLGDPTARLRLAGAAIQQNWTVRRLRDAVHAVRGGADPAEVARGGAEEVAPPVAALLPPGRLVTRAERWADELAGWQTQWRAVKPARLPKAQRERLAAAVASLQARLAELAAELGEG